MRLRMWIFSILALLSFGWVFYGLSATSQVASDLSKTPVPTIEGLTAEDASAARNVGAAIGSGLGITFFACTGLPLALIFSLLAWRNQVGLRSERRHREQMEAQERQLHALQQTAMAQTAQTAMQFAGMQQTTMSGSLPSPDASLQAKFDTARELINDKEYDAARAILRKIDDPKARDWLEKIDRIAPKT